MTTDPFDVCSMDPPWKEDGGGVIPRGAQHKYAGGTHSVEAISQIVRLSPVWNPAPNALLWMWATETFVEDALWLIRDLGFRRCAGFVWDKSEPLGEAHPVGKLLRALAGTFSTMLGRSLAPVDRALKAGLFIPTPKPGMGQWTRMEHEHLFLCRRGDVDLPPTDGRHRSIIRAPRTRKHSEKPAAAWQLIENTSSHALMKYAQEPRRALRKLEMFGRTSRPGWTTWGDEAPEGEAA